MEAGLKYDQSYSVGMMAQVEYHLKEYQKTCHVYVVNLLEALLRKANLTFEKFISDQVKAIEDTRVTIKKRTGILSFMKIFPVFYIRFSNYFRNLSIESRGCCLPGMVPPENQSTKPMEELSNQCLIYLKQNLSKM